MRSPPTSGRAIRQKLAPWRRVGSSYDHSQMSNETPDATIDQTHDFSKALRRGVFSMVLLESHSVFKKLSPVFRFSIFFGFSRLLQTSHQILIFSVEQKRK